MKALFNCSTNFVGGGVQNTTNFIIQSINDKNVEWYYAVSSVVFEQLKNFNLEVENIHIFEQSPARSKKERKRLLEIEKSITPDVIYTMSGPAYVKFKNIHLLGFSDANLIVKNEWDRTFFEKTKDFLLGLYKMYFFRKADYWIFQTEVSRKDFIKKTCVSEDKTFVVLNSCGKHYYNLVLNKTCESTKVLKILVPSADFSSKNLKIIPYVAKELKQRIKSRKINKIVKFVFTLPFNSNGWNNIVIKSKELDVENMIINHGPFSVAEGPDLYKNSFLVFFPTLLETFSGVFVESMATGTILIVSDRAFSRDICKNAAIYFDPKSVKSGVDAIIKVIEMNKQEKDELKNKGFNQIKTLPDAQQRYVMIKNVLIKIINSNRKTG